VILLVESEFRRRHRAGERDRNGDAWQADQQVVMDDRRRDDHVGTLAIIDQMRALAQQSIPDTGKGVF
jgi:hypothetical protein